VGYREALGSLWKLIAEQPVLREASAVGFLTFAAFSSFWTNWRFCWGLRIMAGRGAAAALACWRGGALVASFAGRIADRRGARWVVAMGVECWSPATLCCGLRGITWRIDCGRTVLDMDSSRRRSATRLGYSAWWKAREPVEYRLYDCVLPGGAMDRRYLRWRGHAGSGAEYARWD